MKIEVPDVSEEELNEASVIEVAPTGEVPVIERQVVVAAQETPEKAPESGSQSKSLVPNVEGMAFPTFLFSNPRLVKENALKIGSQSKSLVSNEEGMAFGTYSFANPLLAREKAPKIEKQSKLLVPNDDKMVLRPRKAKAVASVVKKSTRKRKSSTGRTTPKAKVAKMRAGVDSPSSSMAPRSRRTKALVASPRLVKKTPVKRRSSSKSKAPPKKVRPNATRVKARSGKKNPRQ